MAEIQAVCAKWELGATPIGHVTEDGIFRVRHNGLVVAAIPGQRLVDDCPIYDPEAREGADAQARRAARPTAAPEADLHGALELLLDTPNLASKRWVYEQYDSTVQASTVLGPGGDAGVLRVPGTAFGLAVTVDCNNRLVALDPYEGGKAAVAEAARNIACTGARAARDHRLPQLRQPREARGLLSVSRGLPRHRRRVPRVRHPGDRRQRQLLQREPDRRRGSDADRRHGGPARARRRPGPEPLLLRPATRS